jgi:hypothetical protein
MSKKLTGSFVALITPFNKDGSVDFSAFRALLKFQADHRTSAVLIMGSTGETSMLSPDEKKKIIVETAKMKTPRMPIFFGCTGQQHRGDHRERPFRQGQAPTAPFLQRRPTSARRKPTSSVSFLTSPTRPICRSVSTTIHRG